MLAFIWGKQDNHTLLEGCKCMHSLWKSVWQLCKTTRNKTNTWSKYITPEHITKGYYVLLRRYVFIHVH